MGDDDYDDYSKELNQYKKSKDRGRGLFFVSNFLQKSKVSFYLNWTYVVCFFLFSYIIEIIVCAHIKYGQRLK